MTRAAVLASLLALLALGGATSGRAGCCDPYEYLTPQWLPGGERLLFWDAVLAFVDQGSIRSDETGDVYALKAHFVLEGAYPSLSPDGKQIAAISRESRLLVAGSDGSGKRHFGAADAAKPAWSPDGSRIAYQGRRETVRMLELATGTDRSLGAGSAPSWSADGARLVVRVDSAAAKAALEVVALDGTRRRLAADVDPNALPVWSPDGRWIAFLHAPAGRGGLWLVRPDGSGAHVLRAHADNPAWAPDGTHLAAGVNGELAVIGIDGGTRPLGVSAGNEIAWSPDGSRLAFVVGNNNGSGINVVNADGTGLRTGPGGCVPDGVPPPLVACSGSGGHSVPASSAAVPLSWVHLQNLQAGVRGPVELQLAVRDRESYRVRGAPFRITVFPHGAATPRPARGVTSGDGVAPVSLTPHGRLPKSFRVVVEVLAADGHALASASFTCRTLHIDRHRGC